MKASRSIWKPNTVFSVSLRNGTYCLVQTFESKTRLAIFNPFRDNDVWSDVELKPEAVFFYCSVYKNFFQNGHITRRSEITPCLNLEFPARMISIGCVARKVQLWQDTQHQREVVILGNSPNSICSTKLNNGKIHLEYSEIERSEYNEYCSLEVTTLRSYPELNERLLLCSTLGKNYDPLKELAFDRPLCLECIDYIDLISGKRQISELGY
jgi:hypothetical protein